MSFSLLPSFNNDICRIISSNIIKPYYKLLDWINIDNLNYDYLSYNPKAIDLLRKNKDKINWKLLSRNPNAIEILNQNQDKIDWYYFS